MAFTEWKRKVAIVFYIVSVISLMVTIERMVFDVFGQMWGTMIVNGMTALCTLTGIMGVCIKEKVAIIVFAIWNLISIGLNVVVVLIYNDVGLLKEKEHYLGATVGNDNWWKEHGISCFTVTEGSGAFDQEEKCFLSYAVIETIHGFLYTVLAVLTLFLSLSLLWPRKKQPVYYIDDDESFSYVTVGQFYEFPRPHRYFRRWSHLTQNTSDTTV